MALIRTFALVLLEYLLNMGLAMGITFAAVMVLRPLTNRFLRPKYRVALWMMAWVMGVSPSFYSLIGVVRIFPVTFRGWFVPEAGSGSFPIAYVTDLAVEGTKTFTLPGGVQIPFALTEESLNVLAVLAAVFVAGALFFSVRGEKKIKILSRRGEPMDRTWMQERGADMEGVQVRIMPDLPASFVCRVAPGVHNICLQRELPPEQMELVLKHELAHIRASHVWLKGIVSSLLLLYGWNPIMWAAARLACRDMELACDEAVLDQLDEDARRTYARTLVELGSGRHLWSGLTCFGECDAEIRVRSAVRWKRERKWSAVIVWPALILAFLFLFSSPA